MQAPKGVVELVAMELGWVGLDLGELQSWWTVPEYTPTARKELWLSHIPSPRPQAQESPCMHGMIPTWIMNDPPDRYQTNEEGAT